MTLPVSWGSLSGITGIHWAAGQHRVLDMLLTQRRQLLGEFGEVLLLRLVVPRSQGLLWHSHTGSRTCATQRKWTVNGPVDTLPGFYVQIQDSRNGASRVGA